MVLLRGTVDFLEGGILWEVLASLGVCPRRELWDPGFFFHSLPLVHVVSSLFCVGQDQGGNSEALSLRLLASYLLVHSQGHKHPDAAYVLRIINICW